MTEKEVSPEKLVKIFQWEGYTKVTDIRHSGYNQLTIVLERPLEVNKSDTG